MLDILRDFGLVLLGAWTARFPSGRFALDGALGLGAATDDDDEEEDE
ncbi:hypothetical protein ACFOY2_28035 [Nonomuraea purpurea]|uniref:Uncharacterized protein n=1 Tax=Nonomuraea purpurea TaxID=1849276 RepID=A0ABV8GEM3_9ACTN